MHVQTIISTCLPPKAFVNCLTKVTKYKEVLWKLICPENIVPTSTAWQINAHKKYQCIEQQTQALTWLEDHEAILDLSLNLFIG